jgi:nicotinamide riboside kinase
MEKIFQTGMNTIKVAVLGAESTGKTSLCKELAQHFSGEWVPEYARTYVESLKRPYNYQDVMHIASVQKKEFHKIYDSLLVFFDTELIITKIWFEVVWKKCPQWIVNEIINSQFDCYLVCDTSLPWQADAVRENGGEMRNILHAEYCKNLDLYNKHYHIVTGNGQSRVDNAIQHINKIISANTRKF